MEFFLSDATPFRNVMRALKDYDALNLEFDENGISSTIMDSSHVSLASLHLDKSFFDQYSLTSSNFTLGINLVPLSKILTTVENGDSMKISVDTIEADTLDIFITNESTSKDIHFSLNLMELEIESLQVPDTEYMFDVEFATSHLFRTFSDISIFGDTCTFCFTPQKIQFNTKGNTETKNVEITFISAIAQEVSNVEQQLSSINTAFNVAPTDQKEGIRRRKKTQKGMKEDKIEIDKHDEETTNKKKNTIEENVNKEICITDSINETMNDKSTDNKSLLKETNQYVADIRSMEEDDFTQAEFALKYLLIFGKAKDLCSKTMVSLSPDMPLCLSFDLPMSNTAKLTAGQLEAKKKRSRERKHSLSYLKYYLAPKIDDD